MSIYSRTNPYHAYIKQRSQLTLSESTKQTFHIELDLSDRPLRFAVGDSVGILPTNSPHAVDALLTSANLDGSAELFDSRSKQTVSLRAHLMQRANLAKCTTAFLKMLMEKGAKEIQVILEDKHKVSELLRTHHIADILKLFPGARLAPQDFANLLPLLPRFYSIASSPSMFPNEIHLTVASLTYSFGSELRHGTGSYFLCYQAEVGRTEIPIYVQMSNGFTLPSDPDASIIMIGPGTGIAPFRAFLQERLAQGHTGRNWLFFGERNRSTDFYYSDFFLQLERENRLRLDLAFSRDQAEKIYVQHKLWEQRASLFDWIQNGAYLYLCGDAENMAKDVELTLLRIARDQGQMLEEEAKAWLKSLRQSKRFLLDVY